MANNRGGHFQDLKVPLTWTVGLALVVAAVIAVALLLSDRRETLQSGAYGAARQINDMVDQPVGQAVAAPGRWASQGLGFLGNWANAANENRKLRQEVQELRQWRDVALALQDVNNRYKSLLGFRTEPPIPMVAARVVLDSRGPFANTRLADSGREAGVQVGNPVMSDRGLIGRIVGVTKGASRVLLLTDVASRTAVLVDRTDARAILAGDGSANPKLDYLRGVDAVRNGDRILTSGDGGLFPRGLPIGTAVKGLDGVWRVQLDADSASIDYVQILLFKDFSLLVDQKDLAATHMPTAGQLPPEADGEEGSTSDAKAPTAPKKPQPPPKPTPPPAAAAPPAPGPTAAAPGPASPSAGRAVSVSKPRPAPPTPAPKYRRVITPDASPPTPDDQPRTYYAPGVKAPEPQQ